MTILRRFVRDRRRSFGWWSVAMVGLVGMTAGLYPSIRGQQSFDETIQQLPESLKALFGAAEGVSFTSPPGYLHGRLFSFTLPIVLLIFGIGLGARAIAGSEEDGSLEHVLANPISRARLAAERFGAMTVLVVVLTAVSSLALLAMAPALGLLEGVTAAQIVAAHALVCGVALVHGFVAFAVGGATGRRSIAIAAASAVAVVGYVIQGAVAAAPSLEVLRFASVWHWYLQDNLFIEGVPVLGPLVILGLATALAAGGVAAFARRDLR